MKTFAIALATLMTGCVAVTANATTLVQGEVVQQVVRYADLDLQNAADAETLLRRIKSAARNVCVRSAGLMPIEVPGRRLRRCAADATARAVADVNARHAVEIRVAAVARQ